MSKKTKTTPVYRINRGNIEAAIWSNDGKTGPFHSVTFKRSYKTADGSYRDSHAYTVRDLSELARVLHEAHVWIEKNLPAAEPATRKKAS